MTLTTAYWCVLIAALLPYVWTGVAKAKGNKFDNRNPREWLARQESALSRRANAAHLNAFEAFPAFAASIVFAQLAGVSETRIATLAVVFVVARIMHGLLYVADQATLRSIAWAVGIGCVVVLLINAAQQIGLTG